MVANVPAMESGSARHGMTVARGCSEEEDHEETRAGVSQSVNWTSATDARMDCERS